jgi:hypothetical protein
MVRIGRAARDTVRQATARLQLQTAALGAPAPSAALYGSGQGTVGKAKAGLGVDWLGKVKAADGSTEPERALCCSLWRVDLVRQCSLGLGRVWIGMAGFAAVTVADGSTGGFDSLCCSRKGVVGVRLFMAWNGSARQGALRYGDRAPLGRRLCF